MFEDETESRDWIFGALLVVVAVALVWWLRTHLVEDKPAATADHSEAAPRRQFQLRTDHLLSRAVVQRRMGLRSLEYSNASMRGFAF